MWKHYQEDRTAARYDSHMPLAGATLMYSAPKDWLLYGGADWSHDLTKEAEQASVRKGLRIGAVKTFDGGLGLRANLRYTRRTFDAPGTIVYRFPRKDHEYQANLSFWHDKISWKRLYAATQFPLSENRQQYEKFLHTQKHADFHERGKGFQISAKMPSATSVDRIKNRRIIYCQRLRRQSNIAFFPTDIRHDHHPANILASVDLGSNSFRLRICENNNGQLKVIDSFKQMVRFAAGLDEQKNLSAASQEQALTVWQNSANACAASALNRYAPWQPIHSASPKHRRFPSQSRSGTGFPHRNHRRARRGAADLYRRDPHPPRAAAKCWLSTSAAVRQNLSSARR